MKSLKREESDTMGQALSAIFKWIFTFWSNSSDEQQTPSTRKPEPSINIIFDNTTSINQSSSVNVVTSSPQDEEEAPSCHIINVSEAINPGAGARVKWKNHYCSHHRILLVGEGDFSFSASLTNIFGSAHNIVATSLNSKEFLAINYGNAMSNIQSIQGRGGLVLNGIDATQIANYPGFNHLIFDRIIFNFPLAGFFKDESRHSQICRHRKLVRGFLENAKKMISENGETHITHKCSGFFREWNLESLAADCGLGLLQELHFKYRDYPGYNTKYGFGGDRNFNCNPSKTYRFGLAT